MTEVTVSIAFDESKQKAFLGWALKDNVFWSRASRVVLPEWITDPFLRRAWKAMLSIGSTYNRKPEQAEICSWGGFENEDQNTKAKIASTVAEAVVVSNSIGMDIVQNDMDNWMSAIEFRDMMRKSTALHNVKNLKGAWDAVEKSLLKYKSSSFQEGINPGFRASSDIIDLERQDRLRNIDKLLSYGILFLDEALYGMLPTELVVLGAKTGAGKTEAATAIALHNASLGRRVHYFALEAEQFEIERRVKYGKIANYYYSNGGTEHIDYGAWRVGRLEPQLAHIEEFLRPQLVNDFKNLNVLYRKDGDFSLATLQKYLLSLVGKTDLIILDHLHYIDTEEKEENKVYKDVIMLLRDMVLRYEIPVIVVAHLRKSSVSRADYKIVPTIDDFHGTSNITKVATTAIMIGKATEVTASKPGNYLWPTYFRVSKSRMDGSRTFFIALTEFNSRTKTYEPDYKLGKGVDMDSNWEQLKQLQYWQHYQLHQIGQQPF